MTQIYKKPDIHFFVRKKVTGEYSIELGDDIITHTDLLTNEELISWAEENDLNELSVDEIRTIKNRHDIENENIMSSPESRAFDFFQNELTVELPPELGIEFIEGFVPGNDCREVVIRDISKITNLQLILNQQNLNINFTVIENHV